MFRVHKQSRYVVGHHVQSECSGLLCTLSHSHPGEFCAVLRAQPSNSQGMHYMSPTVAGSHRLCCGATADRMELNPVWALGVKGMTMGIFYRRLSDITALHHKVCPQKSLASTIKRSVRAARIWGELQNICCKNVLNNWEYVLPFCACRKVLWDLAELIWQLVSWGKFGLERHFLTDMLWAWWLTDNSTTRNPFCKTCSPRFYTSSFTCIKQQALNVPETMRGDQ